MFKVTKIGRRRTRRWRKVHEKKDKKEMEKKMKMK